MKKTTKIVWMAMAIIAFSFSSFATEPQSMRLDFKQGTAHYEKTEYEKAFQFFKMEADKGDAEAQFWVGRCYANGEGVAKNYMFAAEWYTKSANQDYFKAQHNLALLYYGGNGVKQDYSKALELVRKAEDNHGHPMSQNMIGTMYYYGQGVTKDYVKAKEWFSKAAKQGYEESRVFLELIRKKEQPAPKSINWEVLEDDLRVKIQYTVDKISIKVLYSKRYEQRIVDIFLYYYEEGKKHSLSDAEKELEKNFRLKTINELNSFLLKHHNEFFYMDREFELVKFIKDNAPARKTIKFE